MPRGAYPFIKTVRPDAWAFPLEVVDIFEAAGGNAKDEYTYTTRFSIDPERTAVIENLKEKIRGAMEPQKAERFIALMEEHDWDVSFVVDTY